MRSVDEPVSGRDGQKRGLKWRGYLFYFNSIYSGYPKERL